MTKNYRVYDKLISGKNSNSSTSDARCVWMLRLPEAEDLEALADYIFEFMLRSWHSPTYQSIDQWRLKFLFFTSKYSHCIIRRNKMSWVNTSFYLDPLIWLYTFLTC